MATERIPLTQPIESRTGSFDKDSYSSNCVFETRDQKREFLKRPGLVLATQIIPITPPSVNTSQGLVSYKNKAISVINNTVYSTDPNSLVTTTLGSTSVSTSQSYFVKTFLDNYLFFHNKINAYLINPSGAFVSVGGKLSSIQVVNGGGRFSQGATIVFSGSTTCAATPTIDVNTGAVTSVAITNAGSGLTVVPSVTVGVPTPVSIAGTGTIATYNITVANITGMYIGMVASGTGIAVGAKINGFVGTTTVVVDFPHTGAVSGTITFTDLGYGPYILTAYLSALPTGPYVSGCVFLDNYAFIATASTAMSTDTVPVPVGNRIYNSALGDPTSWNALNFLSFEQTTDSLVGIVKHLNYLVAFGTNSTQFYYDASTALGSPLGVAQSYTSEIGCASGDSIVATDNTVLWMGLSKTHGRSMYMMDGVSPIKISTNNIDKFLEADNLSKVTAFCYKFSGHTLYIMTLHNTNQTLVYDIMAKQWYQWTQYAIASSDQPNPGTYVESYFRPSFFADVTGIPYMLDDDTAKLYYPSTTVYQDDGQPIYCRTVTDIMDNGTTKRKFYGRLEIIGDKVAGIMQVRHSGDDYNSWSSYRSVNLNAPRAQVYLSGQDRRRSWEFLCTSNVPLRLDGAEIDFRIGEMDQEQSVGGGRYRG